MQSVRPPCGQTRSAQPASSPWTRGPGQPDPAPPGNSRWIRGPARSNCRLTSGPDRFGSSCRLTRGLGWPAAIGDNGSQWTWRIWPRQPPPAVGHPPW